MALPDGYTDLAPGKIASVVTYLQMFEPARYSAPARPDLQIRRERHPELTWYRELFRGVGANWLWFGRLVMSDEELASVLHDERIDVFALLRDGEDVGLLELDRREPGEVELSYLGVVEEMVGQGAGRLLMARALEEAWSHQPKRVWVHTCSLDHPSALGFYQKAGFVPYKRAIEIADDPRVLGVLPRSAAPWVPII